MLQSYTDQGYDIPEYIVLSPYLQKNPGLHKVYHDKWEMRYLSLNKTDEEILRKYYQTDVLTNIRKEIAENDVKNSPQRQRRNKKKKIVADPLSLSAQTYLIIKTKEFQEKQKQKTAFKDTYIKDENELSRIELDKKDYNDIINFAYLKEADGSEIRDKIENPNDVQNSLKKLVDFDTIFLYFYPLKPKDETKTNGDADETKEDDGTKFQPNDTVKRLRKNGTPYAGDYKFIRYDGRDEAIIKNNRGTEILTKIKNIKKKLFDLQSIWDDQEDLMVPPPSSLGLAARKAREFMVFE